MALIKIKSTFFIFLFVGFFSSYAQVGIGITNPSASAILELNSVDKGFLPPRLTDLERDAIVDPVNGLVIYNKDKKRLQFYYQEYWCYFFQGTADIPVITSLTGLEWMDRNLGATTFSSSINGDINSYGDLFQWGRAADGHEKRNSTLYNDVFTTSGVSNFLNDPSSDWYGKFILRNSGFNNWVDPSIQGVHNLWDGVEGINNPCPPGFRLPTEVEWLNEVQSWTSSDLQGAFDSALKLVSAGRRNSLNGNVVGINARADYWSSTVNNQFSRRILIDNNTATFQSNSRAGGASVRCVKNY